MVQRGQKDPSASVRVMGDITLIMLTKGYVAVIDTQDLDLVEGRHWWAKVDSTTVYACCSVKIGGKSKKIRMHRLIAGVADEQKIDHGDGNGLHNRRSNLRAATTKQNNRNTRRRRDNTSGLKGVSRARAGKWAAYIKTGEKVRNLGSFTTKEAAHARYCEEAKKHFGEFARTE